jgi:hypothetical protein
MSRTRAVFTRRAPHIYLDAFNFAAPSRCLLTSQFAASPGSAACQKWPSQLGTGTQFVVYRLCQKSPLCCSGPDGGFRLFRAQALTIQIDTQRSLSRSFERLGLAYARAIPSHPSGLSRFFSRPRHNGLSPTANTRAPCKAEENATFAMREPHSGVGKAISRAAIPLSERHQGVRHCVSRCRRPFATWLFIEPSSSGGRRAIRADLNETRPPFCQSG